MMAHLIPCSVFCVSGSTRAASGLAQHQTFERQSQRQRGQHQLVEISVYGGG